MDCTAYLFFWLIMTMTTFIYTSIIQALTQMYHNDVKQIFTGCMLPYKMLIKYSIQHCGIFLFLLSNHFFFVFIVGKCCHASPVFLSRLDAPVDYKKIRLARFSQPAVVSSTALVHSNRSVSSVQLPCGLGPSSHMEESVYI